MNRFLNKSPNLRASECRNLNLIGDKIWIWDRRFFECSCSGLKNKRMLVGGILWGSCLQYNDSEHLQLFYLNIPVVCNLFAGKRSRICIEQCLQYPVLQKIRSSTDIWLVFSGKISKALLDFVLCYCYTTDLKTPNSREKNEGRRYFDYCGITTTEYKWTTQALMVLLYPIDVLKYLNVSSSFKVHFDSVIPASLAGVFLHSIPLSSLYLNPPCPLQKLKCVQ